MMELDDTTQGDAGTNKVTDNNSVISDTANLSTSTMGTEPELSDALKVLIKAELALLKPAFEAEIKSKRKTLLPGHVLALLDVKLEEAAKKMPKRWKLDELFDAEKGHAFMLADHLYSTIEDLQKKDKSDSSAEVLVRRAKALLQDWTDRRRPKLEIILAEAKENWYSPEQDELPRTFAAIADRFETNAAVLEHEISSRPSVEAILRPQVVGCANQTLSLRQEPKKLIHFDVSKVVPKFHGSQEDPDTLSKFASWKATWTSVAEEMETMPGANKQLLFSKLKECLADHALSMVDFLNPASEGSYDEAQKILFETYEDPIAMASSYISRATIGHTNNAAMAESVQKSFNALHQMKDVFAKEGVDMYSFTLIHAFYNAMPADMQADWTGYKVKQKEDYKLRYEEAKASGNAIPMWQAGMVENGKSFSTWLTLYKAKQPKSATSATTIGSTLASTAGNFALQSQASIGEKCFLCKDSNADGHVITRCPRGQNMLLGTWKKECMKASRCYKCAQPYAKGHSCAPRCVICFGKDYDTGHHVLMCPRNRFRSFPPEPKKSAPPPSTSGQQQPQKQQKPAAKQDKKRKGGTGGSNAQMVKFMKIIGESIGKVAANNNQKSDEAKASKD